LVSLAKNHGDRPVVIFLDDLDRCLPSDAIQLLEALKNLFVTSSDSRSIFVCGIDTHVAKQFISEYYNGIEEMFSINYFRKIFNLTISMPYKPDVKELLLKYIEELDWKELLDGQNDVELAEKIYQRGLVAQIESARKYLNIITNLYSFLRFNPDFNFKTTEGDFIINLLILKEAWQPLYENLIKEALKVSSNMETLIGGLVGLPPEQRYFLDEYLGQHSDFNQKILSNCLKNYPTLA